MSQTMINNFPFVLITPACSSLSPHALSLPHASPLQPPLSAPSHCLKTPVTSKLIASLFKHKSVCVSVHVTDNILVHDALTVFSSLL